MKRYFLLWQNIKRIVDIFEKKWMSITLKSDVKIDAAKVYFLKFVDREFLDKEFNKLYDQNRMKYTLQSISFDWLISENWIKSLLLTFISYHCNSTLSSWWSNVNTLSWSMSRDSFINNWYDTKIKVSSSSFHIAIKNNSM